MASVTPQNTDNATGLKNKKCVRQCKIATTEMKISRRFCYSPLSYGYAKSYSTKWRIADWGRDLLEIFDTVVDILHFLMHFLFFKPAAPAPSVFCGVTDAICICT